MSDLRMQDVRFILHNLSETETLPETAGTNGGGDFLEPLY